MTSDQLDYIESKPLDNKLSSTFVSIILDHYNELQIFESKLKKILEEQVQLTTKLGLENRRVDDSHAIFDFDALFKQMSLYNKKLRKIDQEMKLIDDKMARLKKRTEAVYTYQICKSQQIQENKALLEQREQLLTAKPAWES